MERPEETIKKLNQEIEYYKKQLNDLSGSVVSRDYRVAEMNNEIKQMRTGFALIAALNQFKPVPVFEELYDHFTEEINIQLQNDLSLILLPVANRPGYFSPAFIKGNAVVDKAVIAAQQIFIEHSDSLLVNSQTPSTPFIALLIKHFGIPYFILTPVIVQHHVVAYLFTGRKIETVLFAASRLLLHDVHTMEAIAGVIAAIKNQYAQFQLLENERIRISSDMHDEIGSGITHIALLSELIQMKAKDDAPIKKDINVIATSAHKLVQTMSEIIWALNPHNDTLENLLIYTREQSQEYFESLPMKLDIYFPDAVPDIRLSNVQRRNLYLVTREALNNCMKHSDATSIELRLEIINNICVFSVTDNGKGMPATTAKASSNGLRNMTKRMNDINGTLQWAQMEKGTKVEYTLPV